MEVVPSTAGEVSAIASAHAPFLYFEGVSAFAHFNGVIRVTLEAARDMIIPGQPQAVGSDRVAVASDRVIVAHLRMSILAALSLKTAIEEALLLAAPAAGASGDALKPN